MIKDIIKKKFKSTKKKTSVVKSKKGKKTTSVKSSVSESHEKILILSVDRDNDIGDKLSVSGPIVGYDNNIKLGSNLLLKDPEESDANCIFAALKKYNELSKDYIVEIATLTGHSRDNLFFADKNIISQLKEVLKKFPASAIVFVSDGAEDDQVIPIVQNFAPIISKETVIVRQSKHIESIYYTVKKALKDPVFARIIFGIPAIILLLFFFFGRYAFQIVAFILGLYFLIKGFNLEHKVTRAIRSLSNKFSLYRISFVFYLASFFFLAFAIVTGINLYLINSDFLFGYRLVTVLRAVLLSFVLSFETYTIGTFIDLFYFKKLYYIGRSIFTMIAILIISILVDLALQLIINEVDFNVFLISTVISTIVLFLVHKITAVFDVTKEVTNLLIGLPVISKYGMWMGEVIEVNESKNTIKYQSKNSQVVKTISKGHFYISDDRIIV